MNHCTLADNCVFCAERKEGEEIDEYLRGLYCTGNFSACARYRAALDMGQHLVPDDIFPNEEVFVSLFAWASPRRGNPASKRGRPRPLNRLPVSAPETLAASSGHPTAPRQNRGQR